MNTVPSSSSPTSQVSASSKDVRSAVLHVNATARTLSPTSVEMLAVLTAQETRLRTLADIMDRLQVVAGPLARRVREERANMEKSISVPRDDLEALVAVLREMFPSVID